MLYLGNRSHEWVGRCESDTPSYITQIYLVLGTYGGKTGGGKWVKTCPSPHKSHSKCYILAIDQMSLWEYVRNSASKYSKSNDQTLIYTF